MCTNPTQELHLLIRWTELDTNDCSGASIDPSRSPPCSQRRGAAPWGFWKGATAKGVAVPLAVGAAADERAVRRAARMRMHLPYTSSAYSSKAGPSHEVRK